MKRTTPTNLILTKMALVLGMGFAMTTVNAALTDIANSPMATTASSVVKANLMFLLDASGSMNWDFMPDSVAFDPACKTTGSSLTNCSFADPPYNSAQFNGIHYNPAITYTPAVNYDGTSYPSYTTWTAVKNDAFGIQFSGTIDLTRAYPDNVWCNTGSPSTSDLTAPFASGRCKRPIQAGVWTYPNGTYSSQFSAAGTLNPYYYTISSLAWCSSANAGGFGTGTCQPKKTAVNSPLFQYPKYGTGSDGFTRTDIVPGTTTYPRAASRTDCSGAVGATGCTYAQEMTNFANWYAYYRTRMQMMKSAAGLSFKQVTDSFRVGFITINPGSPVASSKYLPMADFTAGAGGQKDQWYTKFYAQNPNLSTPLREALSRVGRYYAHVTTGINNGIADDPVQYSCQQNFTIMSTDGFWNGSAGQKLDGSAIGNQDSNPTTAPRPLLDGSVATTTVTSNSTLNQRICTGTNTVFGSTSCGCSGTNKRVKQQTLTSASTVVTRDGVVLSTTPSTTTTYQNITACSPSAAITGLAFTITPPSPPSAGATTAGPQSVVSTSSTSGPAGYADTLADVAQYYYVTDLRAPGSLGAAVGSPAVQLDVGTINNVPGQPGTDPQNDSANWQHMTTLTLGLGVDGALTYASDYRTNPTGDFLAIKNGTKNWPQPVADTVTAVDDLWHAAVNGRGTYFSARDPAQLVTGLSSALAGVSAVSGSAAAAATSNLEPVAGDNFAYVASYETVRWNGDVEARTIDLNTGAVSATAIWSAQGLLDTLTNATIPGGTNRSIKRFNTGGTNKLQDFTWANLTATEQAYFNAAWIGTGGAALSQWGSLNALQQTAAAGLNLVNFLRGDSTYESQASVAVGNQLYRDRQHVLGDVVDGAPVYVKQISLNYADAGFASPAGANFKECINTGGAGCTGIFSGPRSANVYIAANDGMLHALNGLTGAERWAYIPNILIPSLYRLADKDYANRHQYYVDGSPTVGDVYDPVAAKWKTILVGGLADGGRGYYALDVTDPAVPIGLWEFNVRATASCPTPTVLGTDKDDCDLGLSYGNPIITKLGDGTWVVVMTSGHNNVSPGDGKGYVYVLNPITGVILKKIPAMNAGQFLNPGSTTTPLGLARINNWVDDTSVNNTTLRVYGGDLQGYMWRFNLDAGTAYAIARYTDPLGVAQPVTTKPELGDVSGVAMVFVGTGRYLGGSDLPSTQVQTIYGIKDATNGVAPATPINTRGATVVAQTLTNGTSGTGAGIRTATSNAVDLTTRNGWRADLPVSGERVNVDPKLQLGTLIVGSNIPVASACTFGGTSYLNFLDYKTGGYIQSSGNTLAGLLVGNSLVVGISVVRLPNNKTVAIVTTSDNKYPNLAPPFSSPSPVGRRSSFRELQ